MKKVLTINDFVEVLTINNVKENLIKRFKKRRKELGFSQKVLAMRSGVSYASIRRFESSCEISLSSLLKLADALGTLDEFNNLFNRILIKDFKDY